MATAHRSAGGGSGGASGRCRRVVCAAVAAAVLASAGAQAQQREQLTLREAIARALESNPALVEARLYRELDAHQMRRVRSTFRPKWSLESVAGTYAWNDEVTANATAVGKTRRTADVSFGPRVSWKLPTGGELGAGPRWKRTYDSEPAGGSGNPTDSTGLNVTFRQPLGKGFGRENATAQVQIDELQEKRRVIELREKVATQVKETIAKWRRLRKAKRQSAIAARALEQARTAHDVVEALIFTGRNAERERTRSRANVAAQEIALVEAHRNEAEARSALAEMLGMEASAEIDTADEAREAGRGVDEQRSLDAALAGNAGYAKSAIDLEIKRIEWARKEDEERWDVDLTASADFGGSGPGTLGHDSERYSVRLELSVPLGRDDTVGDDNLTRDEERIRARLDWMNATRAKANARKSVDRAVEDAVRRVRDEERRSKLATEAVALSRLNLEIEEERLRRGRTSAHRIAEVQNEVRRAAEKEVESRDAWLEALDALDLVEGATLSRWGIALNVETGEAWIEGDAAPGPEDGAGAKEGEPGGARTQGVAWRRTRTNADPALMLRLGEGGSTVTGEGGAAGEAQRRWIAQALTRGKIEARAGAQASRGRGTEPDRTTAGTPVAAERDGLRLVLQ